MQGNDSTSQRRYGFACIQCRRKKIKCDGLRPTCRRCQKAQSRCTYKETDASATRLQTELNKCQNELNGLRQAIKALSVSSNADERDVLLQRLADSVGQEATTVRDLDSDGDDAVEEEAANEVDAEQEYGHRDVTVDEHGVVGADV